MTQKPNVISSRIARWLCGVTFFINIVSLVLPILFSSTCFFFLLWTFFFTSNFSFTVNFPLLLPTCFFTSNVFFLDFQLFFYFQHTFYTLNFTFIIFNYTNQQGSRNLIRENHNHLVVLNARKIPLNLSTYSI